MNDITAKLFNPTRSFEGDGIVNRPQGGRTIPTVTNLQIVRNQPWIGGAYLTVTWNQENLDSRFWVQINIYSTASVNIPTDVNIKDYIVNPLNLKPLQSPIYVQNSPAEIFVPSHISLPVIITAKTRASNGVLSLDDFEASVSAVINPINKYISRKSADFDVHKSDPYLYVVDTSSISIVANLPPIAEVIQGFCQGIKCVGSSGINNITLTPAGSDTVNGALALNFGIPYTMWIYADKENSDWITTPTA